MSASGPGAPGSSPEGGRAERPVLQPRIRLGALVGLLVLVGTTPWWSSTSAARVIVDILVLVAVSQLWSYLAGGTGIVALGVNGFAGVGAYGLWFLADRGVNPVLAVGGAALGAGLVALVAAPLVLRLPAALAAVASWAVGQAALEIVVRTGRLGGDADSRSIPAVVELGSARDGVVSWLAVVAGVGAVAMVYAHRHSMGGLTLVAAGDDPDSARALELPVRRARRTVWLLAAVVVGSAGALMAFRTAQVSPAAFDPARWTLPVIAVAGVGGLATMEGPLIAAVLYVVLHEVLPGSDGSFALGAALVGVVGLVVGSDGWWGTVRDLLPVDRAPVRRLGRAGR